MMLMMTGPVQTGLLAFASRLKFPQLFVITLALFLLDLLIPDLIPLADEVLLGLLTLMFGLWKGRGDQEEQALETKPPTKDITPPGGPDS